MTSSINNPPAMETRAMMANRPDENQSALRTITNRGTGEDVSESSRSSAPQHSRPPRTELC
jgi:hypothetical protein